MKKTFILAIALIAGIFSANAQFRDFTADNSSVFQLVQVDTSANGTFFFFTAKASKSAVGFNVNENTIVTADGVMKRFKLLGTGNIPMSNENSYSYIEKEGGVLNFVLVFDSQIPIDKPLTISGDGDSEGEYSFNSIKNIRINTSSVSEKMNLTDFLEYTDFVQSASYVSDDHNYRAYTFNGVTVAGALTNGSPYGMFYITITNMSDHDIAFSMNNIKIEAKKKEKDEFEYKKNLSRLEYTDYLAEEDAYASRSYQNAINPTASLVHNFSTFGVKYDDYASKIALSALEGALRKNDRAKVDEYNEALQQERNRQWRNYIQSVTIKDGETYGGFVAFPNKRMNFWQVTVDVAGKKYTYIYHK